MKSIIKHREPPTLCRYFFPLLLLAIVMVMPVFQNVGAAEKTFPFQPGEKLTFRLKWNFIPAGEAVLEVLPAKTINGINAYHFVLTAKTNAVVDVFYKVRNRIDSYTDSDMTHSILFIQKKNEGSTKRDIVVTFNWSKNEAQYANFGEKNKPISIRPGAFDPLSVFYYVRLLDLKVGAEIKRPVTDGKKSIIGKTTIKKKETIKVAGRIYDALLFEPDIEHVGGVFEKSKNAKIKLWVTADRRKIPLKIKSKVVVGSFVGELISAEGLRD